MHSRFPGAGAMTTVLRGTRRGPAIGVGLAVGLLCAAALSADEGRAPAPLDGAAISCGTYRRLHSNVLGEDRTLRVRLPEGYEKTDRKYPVLYQLDSNAPVFLEASAAVEYLVDMTDMVPDHIIVGIENTDRRRDMDPERGAEKFGRFITTELAPFVEGQYRTSGFRILAGQSFSALFSLHLFLRQPEAFDAYILSSPGLHKDALVPLFERELGDSGRWARAGRKMLFVAVGKRDSYDPDGSITARSARVLSTVTRTAPAVVVKSTTYEDEGHVPFPSVYDGLRWIYAAK
jgi:predicted alpha/beta superfamily hydrolase